MIENIKLMTRSTASDYEFFGTETSTAWTGKYQKYFFDDTKANGLTLFGEIENAKWKLFVGRIPSSNRDSFTRQLSYILKAEGTRGNSDSLYVAKLVTFILKTDFEMKIIGEKFSNEFTTDFINGLDNKRHTTETENEINEKLESIFKSIDIEQSESVKEIDGLKFDYFSADNAGKMSELVSLISDQEVQIDGKIMFAVTMLPIESSETDTIFAESDKPNGLVLTTNKEFSDALPIVKKKSFSLRSKAATESPTTSRSGWTRALKTLIVLLIISLITNCVLILRPFGNQERTLSIMAKQDSLNLLKKSLDDNTVLLTKANRSLDSLKRMQCYKNTQFDLAEFAKTGNCRIFIENKTDTFTVYSTIVPVKNKTDVVNKTDTFTVYSIFDLKNNKCKVSVCKGDESKGGTDVNLK